MQRVLQYTDSLMYYNIYITVKTTLFIYYRKYNGYILSYVAPYVSCAMCLSDMIDTVHSNNGYFCNITVQFIV